MNKMSKLEEDQNNIEKINIDKNLKGITYQIGLAENFIYYLKGHPRASQDAIDNAEQVKKKWEEELKKLMVLLN